MRGDDEIVCRHATMKMTTTTQTTGMVCEGGVSFGFRSDADIAGVATIATIATARLSLHSTMIIPFFTSVPITTSLITTLLNAPFTTRMYCDSENKWSIGIQDVGKPCVVSFMAQY